MLIIYRRTTETAYGPNVSIPMPTLIARTISNLIDRAMFVNYWTEWN